MFLTEFCECGKIKQVGKLCKPCSLAATPEFEQPERTPVIMEAVARKLEAEDDMERARR